MSLANPKAGFVGAFNFVPDTIATIATRLPALACATACILSFAAVDAAHAETVDDTISAAAGNAMNNNASRCLSKRVVAGSIDPTIADSVETSTALSSPPAGADLDLTFGVVRIGGENATEIHSANPVFRPNGHSGGCARLTIKETFSISGNGSGSFTIDRWIAAN